MSYEIITSKTGALTMSSLEIMKLTGKRHSDVLRDIRVMLEELNPDMRYEGNQPLRIVYDSHTKRAKEYQLPRRECDILIAGYSIKYRAAIVDRWRELESSNITTLPDFKNPAIAARAWADEVEQKQAALLQLESAKPAVEFVERYVSADSGSKGFRQVAKLLNANEREFRQFLFDKKIMYRLAGEWMPYGNHADAGRFEVKTGVADNEHAFNSAKFTAKGINWIAGKWAIHCIQEAA